MTQAAPRKTSRPRAGAPKTPSTGRPGGRAASGGAANGTHLNGAHLNGKASSAGAIALAGDAGPGRRRVVVGRSGVHGKGVFAARPISRGETVIEYRGEIISWKEALRRHPHDPDDPFHTFYFHIDDKRVIDGKHHGNAARWINHACDPNCEADEVGGRIFIKALRDLAPGDELFYDYRLVIDDRYTAKLKKQYECRCGSPACRGTMLAPKR